MVLYGELGEPDVVIPYRWNPGGDRTLMDRCQHNWYRIMEWWRVLSIYTDRMDGFVQERRNSSASAMELSLSCTNPSICVMKSVNHLVKLDELSPKDVCWEEWYPNSAIIQLLGIPVKLVKCLLSMINTCIQMYSIHIHVCVCTSKCFNPKKHT